jgi:hypothetical protein
MGNLRASLTADEAGSLDWIRTSYLSLRHHAEGIEPIAAYDGLVYSLDPATPRTAFGLIMLAVALALAAGLALANRHRAWLWQGALVGAAAIDLVLFGVGFHQKVPVGQLSQGTPAIQFLQCEVRSADCGAEFGPESVVGGPPSAVQEWRVFTSGTSPSLESNRLVPFRVQDIGGYSSLESRRNYTYWTTIAGVQNQLLDMANVRYLVYPVRGPALPSYRLVPFDPERPLMMGGRDTLGGFESFTVGGERADRLQIVAALTRALDVPQGETVAEITVVPREGSSAVIPLRAGIDTAEWAYDRPDVAGKTKHQKPPEIAFRRPDVFLADGTQYSLFLYYTERDLPRPMEVERIEVRYVNPAGSIELYGIGLYSFDTGLTAPVTSQMRTKLRLVYQDDEVRIFENAATFPRGYVVPEARMAPSGVTALSAMQDTAFDPTREVMLEGLEAAGWPLEVPEPRENRGGLAEVGSLGNGVRFPIPRPEPLDIGTDRLTYRVAAPEGGYFVHVAHFFPGWRAWIDGVEAPILLANSLFRAVPLPPGEHVVELRYEPTAVVLGLQISLWTAAIALATLSGAFLARGLERRHRDP